jgi:hypothetical protein
LVVIGVGIPVANNAIERWAIQSFVAERVQTAAELDWVYVDALAILRGNNDAIAGFTRGGSELVVTFNVVGRCLLQCVVRLSASDAQRLSAF